MQNKPRIGRPLKDLELTDEERDKLELIVRRPKTFGLQPHRTEAFKLSPDPLFVEKVRDIAGLYLNPPEHAVVLCVDEKS